MREMKIKPSTLGLYQWKPGQHAFYSSTGNQLKYLDKPTAPGQQWVGDFTYLKTKHGWLYHAAIIDLFHRKVVGWSFAKTRNVELTLSALRMALNNETIEPGCLFHSDQGVEYAAHDYRDALTHANMTRSMSRRATPLDNAVMESYFHTYKAELVRRRLFKDDIEAVAKTVQWIAFYNHERRHSALNFESPEKYAMLCA